MSTTLFSPLTVGDLTFVNRMVMAPLTRSRAGEGGVPTALMAEYYAQRASAGLLITEATQVHPTGQGYIATPGMHTDAQEAGWKSVVSAIHAQGGKACLQLWHVGRISHTSFQPGGAAPLAPSAIRANMKAYTVEGFVDCSEPQAMSEAQIREVVSAYGQATRRAMAAGFDMVEVHAANGYLIDQFLRSGSNQRTDAYGGSVDNRLRFLKEVVAEVLRHAPAHRVGCRISPVSGFNDIADAKPAETFSAVAQFLGSQKLAYLHIIEGQTGGERATDLVDFAALRATFKAAGGHTTLVNNGYTREMGDAAVSSGAADWVAYGVPFLANPDLVARFKNNWPLNTPDQATFYGGAEKGYTDYPRYAAK